MTNKEYKEQLQKNVQKLHSEMNEGKEYMPLIAYPSPLSNCDEVLKFLVDYLDSHFEGIVEFQGDNCRAEIMNPDGGILCLHPKYKNYAFIVGEVEYDDFFPVFTIHNGESIDEAFGILIPEYCRNEMIATACGEL